MIKKLFLLFSVSFLFAFLFIGCSKSTTTGGCIYSDLDTIAPAAEIAGVQAYLTAHSITAIQHHSGFFYTINNIGTSDSATICNSVAVTYTGWLFSGFKFTEITTPTSVVLGTSIYGWQKGIPLIKTGGNITLYVPPSLAYGAAVSGIIPASSYLIFTIQLWAVQ